MHMLLGEGRFSFCRYSCVNVAELHTAPHLFFFFFGAGWKRVSAFAVHLSAGPHQGKKKMH